MKVILLVVFGFLRTIKCHNLEACSPGYYRCSGYDRWIADYVYSKCIREDLICNGKKDCYFNEDEADCESTTESKTTKLYSKSIKTESPTTTELLTLEDSPTIDVALNHSSVKKELTASANETNSSESKRSFPDDVSEYSSEFTEESPDDPILTRHRTPNLSDKSTINDVIIEYTSKWLEESNFTEESTKDPYWIQHDTSQFPGEADDAPLSTDDAQNPSDYAPYSPDDTQNISNDPNSSETTDDPFWTYDISPRTDNSTWVYDIITDDPYPTVEYAPKERTHIELVIAITITIIIIFFLVVCVIFQKKLSRSRKRRKLSIGRRMRNKYGVGGKFDV